MRTPEPGEAQRRSLCIDAHTARLIAVGASIAANCRPCLEINIGRATKAGATAREIADAIEVGRLVRQGAARKTDQLASQLGARQEAGSVGGCACGPSPAPRLPGADRDPEAA